MAPAVHRWCELSLPDAVQKQEAQLRTIAAHPLGIPLESFSVYRTFLQSLMALPLKSLVNPDGCCDSWLSRLASARAPRPRRDAWASEDTPPDPILPPQNPHLNIAIPCPSRPQHQAPQSIPALPPNFDSLPDHEQALLLEGIGEMQAMQSMVHMEELSQALQHAAPRPILAPRSSLDWGYGGTPPHKGWCNAYGVPGGAPNDFIRQVGDSPDIFAAVVVAGSNMDSTQYVRWDESAHPLDAGSMQAVGRCGIKSRKDARYVPLFRAWQAAAAKLAAYQKSSQQSSSLGKAAV